MNIRLFCLLAAAGVSSACTGNGPGDKDDVDDTATNDDTGDINYEEGCIELSTGQTFAWMEDALKVAADGDTIDLAGCGETFEQQAVITTSGVSITGPGAATMVWNAPVNQAAIEVSGADNVTISGFTFTSTRDGILIESSANTVVDSVDFVGIANTAVVARNSTDTTLSNSTFTAPQYGALQVENGTATASDNIVNQPLGFAFRSMDGSTITAERNEITGTLYTNLDNGLIDGFALWGEGGGFVTDSNVLTDNVIAMLVDGADLTAINDTVSGGIYGIYGLFGELSVDGAEITNPTQFAMVLATQNDSVTVTNTSVYGDPEVVYMTTDPDAWADANAGSVLLQSDGLVTVDGLTLEGYNAQGLAVQRYSSGGTAELSNIDIVSPGRFGIVLNTMDVIMTDVEIDDLRLVDDPLLVNQDYSFSVGYGLLIVNSDVEWTGGGVRNSEVINMVAQSSALTFDQIEAVGGAALGLWSISSSLVMTNSTVSDSPSFGGIANYSGDLVLDSNTFVDNQKQSYTAEEGLNTQYISYSDYVDGSYHGSWSAGSGVFTDPHATFITDGYLPGDVIYPFNYGGYQEIISVDSETQVTLDVSFSYASSNSGWYGYKVLSTYLNETIRYYDSQDVVGSNPNSMTITNNTFNTGSQGLYIDAGDVLIEGNTWTDYNDSPIRIYGADGTAELKDNIVNNAGDYGLICSGATVEIEDFDLSGMVGSEYRYERYKDGVLDYSSSYTFTGPAMSLSGCTATLDTVTLSGANEEALVASESALELYDVNVSEGNNENAGYGLVDISWTSTDPYLLASGVTLTSSASGDALNLYNGHTNPGELLIEDLTIVGSEGVGAALDGITGDLTNLQVQDTSGDGVTIVGGDVTIDGNSTISGAACFGVHAVGVDAQTLSSGSGIGVGDGASTFDATGQTFVSDGVVAGDLLWLPGLRECPYIVSDVSEESLELNNAIVTGGSNLSWYVTSAGTSATGAVTFDGLTSDSSVYGVYVDSTTAGFTSLTTTNNEVGLVCGADTTATCTSVNSSDGLYGCCEP